MRNRFVCMPHRSLSFRQRGMMAVFAIVFLLVVVIFALSQTLTMSGSNIIDTKQQRDSVAALFLAESGLERAMRKITVAAQADALTDTVCTGLGAGGPFALGDGNFSFPGSISTPAACGGGGLTCASCNVKVVGTVGSASRTINLNLALALQNGVTGFGGTATSTPPGITLTVNNTEPNSGAVVFNLAWRRQGSDGQTNVTGGQAQATPCTGCDLDWNIESSSGNPSVGSMGSFRSVDPNSTTTVEQTLDKERNYAEVGALFVSASAATPITETGSYWNFIGGAGSGSSTTGASNTVTGKTNNGALTDCVATPCRSPISDQEATAANWCSRADTLVAGFSGRSTTPADTLSSFTFGPTLRLMQLVAHLPMPSGDIYSEIYYTSNPDYRSASDAVSGARVTGSIGATVTGTIGATFKGTISGTTLTVTTPPTDGVLSVGDQITCTSGGCTITPGTTILTIGGGNTYTLSQSSTVSPAKNMAAASTVLNTTNIAGGILTVGDSIAGTTINSFLTGSGATGTSGTYRLAAALTNPGPTLAATSTTLNVTAASTPALEVGDTIFGSPNAIAAGTTINSFGTGSGGTGTYAVSTPQTVASTQITSNGATITTSGSLDTSGTSSTTANAPSASTIVAVRGGGQLSPGTTVLATPTPSAIQFKVSTRPSTPLNGATICGGICALFNQDPSVNGGMTDFAIVKTAGTTQWAAGFNCLRGVNSALTKPVVSTTVKPTTWSELF